METRLISFGGDIYHVEETLEYFHLSKTGTTITFSKSECPDYETLKERIIGINVRASFYS